MCGRVRRRRAHKGARLYRYHKQGTYPADRKARARRRPRLIDGPWQPFRKQYPKVSTWPTQPRIGPVENRRCVMPLDGRPSRNSRWRATSRLAKMPANRIQVAVPLERFLQLAAIGVPTAEPSDPRPPVASSVPSGEKAQRCDDRSGVAQGGARVFPLGSSRSEFACQPAGRREQLAIRWKTRQAYVFPFLVPIERQDAFPRLARRKGERSARGVELPSRM